MPTEKMLKIDFTNGTIIVDRGRILGDTYCLNPAELLEIFNKVRSDATISRVDSFSRVLVPNPLVSSIFTESAELGSSPAYNLSLHFTARNFNLDEVINRLKTVLEHNEIFRFFVKREHDEVIYEALSAPLNLDIEEHRLPTLSDLQLKIKELTQREFELEGHPLFAVFRLTANEGHHDCVMIIIHHMLIDGEGLNLLHKQLTSTGPVFSQSFADYINISSTTYAYSPAKLERYAQSMIYDEEAASHLCWDNQEWRKTVQQVSPEARHSISHHCRKFKCTNFSYLFFLAILSFKRAFPSRKSAIVMIPYANRENEPAMFITGCMINSVTVQIDLTAFTKESDLLDYLSLNLLDTIMRGASFPLVDVILHSRMQPDYIFNHIKHDFNFEHDLSSSVYNLSSIYPCSIEIREYLNKTDVLLGTDGQIHTDSFLSSFKNMVDQSCLFDASVMNKHYLHKKTETPIRTGPDNSSDFDETVEHLRNHLAECLSLTGPEELKDLAPDSDLFFWGLNSIKGIRFSKSISREFCNDFNFRSLLKLRTLNDIARHLTH